MGRPYYVVKLDADENTVTLGTKQELMRNKLVCSSVNWLIEKPASSFRARVKIRYNHSGSLALVTVQQEKVLIEFDEPIAAITPGQLAVFYIEHCRGSRVVGGGWIDSAID